MLLLENEPAGYPEVVQILCEIYLYNNGYQTEAKEYEELTYSKFAKLDIEEIIDETIKIVGENRREELINYIGDFYTRFNKEDITWKYIATQKVAKAMERNLQKLVDRKITGGELRRIQEMFVEFKRKDKGGFRFEDKMISFVMGPCYDFFCRNKSSQIYAILNENSDLIDTSEDKEYSYALQSEFDAKVSNKVSKKLGEVSDKYDIPKFKDYVNKIQKASFILYKDAKKTHKSIANYDIFTDYKDSLLDDKRIELNKIMRKCGIQYPNRKYFTVSRNKSNFYVRKITSVHKLISEITELMVNGVCLEEIYNRVSVEFEKLKDNQTKEKYETDFLEVYAGIQALREFTSQLVKEGWEPLSIPSDIFQNKFWATRVSTFEDYMVSYDNLKALDYFDTAYDEENHRVELSIDPLDPNPHNAIVTKQILTRFQDSIRNKLFKDMAKYMNASDLKKLNPTTFLRDKKVSLELDIRNLQEQMQIYGILNYYCNIFEMYVSLFEEPNINETVLTNWIKNQDNPKEIAEIIFEVLLRQDLIEQSGLIKLKHVTGDASVVNSDLVNKWINGEVPGDYVNTYNRTVTKGEKSYGGALRITTWYTEDSRIMDILKVFDNKLNNLTLDRTLQLLKDSKDDIISSINSGAFNDDIGLIANSYFDNTLVYPTQEFVDGLDSELFVGVIKGIKDLIYNESFAGVDDSVYTYMAIGFLNKFCMDRNLISNFNYGATILKSMSDYFGKPIEDLTAENYYNFVRYMIVDNYVCRTIVDLLSRTNVKRATMLGTIDLMDKHKKIFSMNINSLTFTSFCQLIGETSIMDCKPRGDRSSNIRGIMDNILRTSISSKAKYLNLLKDLNEVCQETKHKYGITKLDILGTNKHKLMEYANEILMLPNIVNGDSNLINLMSMCTFYEGEYCVMNSMLKSTEFNGKTYYLHRYGYWVTAEDDATPILKYGEIK